MLRKVPGAGQRSASWNEIGQIEMDPDERVSGVIRLLFESRAAGFKREKGAPNQNGEPRAKLRLGKLDRQMAQAMIAGDRARRRISLLLEHLLTSGKSTVSMSR
jgi:hypothetical protein